VERLYLYHWRYGGNATWDSALISQDGTERKAYYALLDGLSLERFKPVPVPIANPLIEPLPPPAPEPPPEPPPPGP
jgi:hypothetical protein